jgi:hypothetical protein
MMQPLDGFLDIPPAYYLSSNDSKVRERSSY